MELQQTRINIYSMENKPIMIAQFVWSDPLNESIGFKRFSKNVSLATKVTLQAIVRQVNADQITIATISVPLSKGTPSQFTCHLIKDLHMTRPFLFVLDILKIVSQMA